MIHIIAQSFPVTGGESDALEIISSSLELSRATVESWNTVWLVTLDPLGSALWIGLIKLGITLGAASILFVALTTGKEIIDGMKINLPSFPVPSSQFPVPSSQFPVPSSQSPIPSPYFQDRHHNFPRRIKNL